MPTRVVAPCVGELHISLLLFIIVFISMTSVSNGKDDKDNDSDLSIRVPDTVICPLCREVFVNPVTNTCALIMQNKGHSFCRGCYLGRYEEKNGSNRTCCVCRTQLTDPENIKVDTYLKKAVEVLGSDADKKWIQFQFKKDQFSFDQDCRLGKGGSGEVFAGTIISTNTPIVVKVIKLEDFGVEDLLRARREVRVLCVLDHPHIVRIYGWFEDQKRLMILMQRGQQSLKDFLKENPSMSTRCCILQQVVSAMDYLHDQHILHRDLKPENILLTKNLDALVIDLGSAYIKSTLSTTRGLTGTVLYMSPEMICGEVAVDEKTDIYSFGVTFAECWTGSQPWPTLKTEASLIHRKTDPLHPFNCIPEMKDCEDDEVIVELVRQCCDPDPRQRPTWKHILKVLHIVHQLLRKQEEALKKEKDLVARETILKKTKQEFEITQKEQQKAWKQKMETLDQMKEHLEEANVQFRASTHPKEAQLQQKEQELKTKEKEIAIKLKDLEQKEQEWKQKEEEWKRKIEQAKNALKYGNKDKDKDAETEQHSVQENPTVTVNAEKEKKKPVKEEQKTSMEMGQMVKEKEQSDTNGFSTDSFDTSPRSSVHAMTNNSDIKEAKSEHQKQEREKENQKKCKEVDKLIQEVNYWDDGVRTTMQTVLKCLKTMAPTTTKEAFAKQVAAAFPDTTPLVLQYTLSGTYARIVHTLFTKATEADLQMIKSMKDQLYFISEMMKYSLLDFGQWGATSLQNRARFAEIVMLVREIRDSQSS